MKLLRIIPIILAFISAGAFAATVCLPMIAFDHPWQDERFDGGPVHFGKSATHEWAFYLCHPRRLDADTARVVYVIAPRGTVSLSAQYKRFAALSTSNDMPGMAASYWSRYVTKDVADPSIAIGLPDMKSDVKLKTGFSMP